MNSPLSTALALSTTSTYAAARRDRDVHRQVTARTTSSRRWGTTRHRGRSVPAAL